MANEDAKFNVNAMTAEAVTYGLNLVEVADLLAKWGPSVLQLVISGLRNGLSLALVREILETLGPLFLRLAVEQADFFTTKRLKAVVATPAAASTVIVGEQVDSFEKSSAVLDLFLKLMPALLKMLPEIMNKYGDQIIAWVIQAITDALNDPTVKKSFLAALQGAAKEA